MVAFFRKSLRTKVVMLAGLAAVMTLFGGSSLATAAPSPIQDISEFALTEQAAKPTAVVTLPVQDASFASTIRTALREYPVVYVLDAAPQDLKRALPDSLVTADVQECRATAVYRNDEGIIYGMASVTSNTDEPLTHHLDQLTLLVNRGQEAATRNLMPPSGMLFAARDSVSGTHYSSIVPQYSWAAYNGADGEWIGWVRVICSGHNLRNDGNSTKDYWVMDVLQETDPGSNGHGTTWETDEVRSKFNKTGSVLDICNCRPNSTSGSGSLAFTLGWPPSLTFTYDDISDVDIDNLSSPSLGYAYWVHTFDHDSDNAEQYYVANPAYEAQVTQNAGLSSYNSVTTAWGRWAIWQTVWSKLVNNWPQYSFTLNKPPY